MNVGYVTIRKESAVANFMILFKYSREYKEQITKELSEDKRQSYYRNSNTCGKKVAMKR